MTQSLDVTALTRRIQLKKKRLDYRSELTKQAQIERDRLQVIAHDTNNDDDWRTFRHKRNNTRQLMKKDKFNYMKKQFEDKNPTKVWKLNS